MKKKLSTGHALADLLEDLEAGRMPDQDKIKRGRAALKGVSKSLKAATAAAAASGNSGRSRSFDEEAVGMAKGDASEVAAKFGCSKATVYLARQKMILEGKRQSGRRRKDSE